MRVDVYDGGVVKDSLWVTFFSSISEAHSSGGKIKTSTPSGAQWEYKN